MNGKITIAVATILILLAVGTYAYSKMEKWGYADSLYFSAVTLSTIGYAGGMHPTTNESKLFTVAYMIIGISLTLVALTSVASYVLEHKYMRKVEKNIMMSQGEIKYGKDIIIQKIKEKILGQV